MSFGHWVAHTVQWGTVPAWVGGLMTGGGFIIAARAYGHQTRARTEEKAELLRQQQRDRDEMARERRLRARRVTASAVFPSATAPAGEDAVQQYELWCDNDSGQTIRNIVVTASRTHPLSEVAPIVAEWPLMSQGKVKKEGSVRLPRDEMGGAGFEVALTFVDADELRWRLEPNGDLHEVHEATGTLTVSAVLTADGSVVHPPWWRRIASRFHP